MSTGTRKKMRLLGLVALTLMLCTPVQAQDTDLTKRATKFQKTVQRHKRNAAWFTDYMKVLLGQNYAKAQPAISKTLTELNRAKSDAAVEQALTRFQGDPAELKNVLRIADLEARVWKPGKVLRRSTINKLWTALYSKAPPAAHEYRLENYETPKEIRKWLFEEKMVNDHLSTGLIIDSSHDTLRPEMDPRKGGIYWLPHVEIPVSDARVMRSLHVTPDARSNFTFTRNGKKYVRYFVHPQGLESPSMMGIMEKYGVKVEYLASPTSSPRSLAIWNAYEPGKPFGLAKVSLTAYVGGLRRINPIDKGSRAVAITRALEKFYKSRGQNRAPPFIAEPMTIFPEGSTFGMIVREVPPWLTESNGKQYVPGSSIASKRPGGGRPQLVDMIERSGMPPMDYLNQKIIEPLVKTYSEVTFGIGIVGEPHQQNVLLEVGRNGDLTGRHFIRDLDSYKIDVETRLRKGLGMRDLAPFADPKVIGNLKLKKARTYYDMSYHEYLGDWADMLSLGLMDTYPEVRYPTVKNAMDRQFRIEIKNYLGIDTTHKTGPLQWGDINEIMEQYRENRLADPIPPQSVSTRVLAEEFNRLDFNRRVMWLDGKVKANTQDVLLLHDGAIELRRNGKVRGIALLEPPNSRGFYKELPYPREEPNRRRLKTLYEKFTRSQGGMQSREVAKSWVKAEIRGAAMFGGAYLLKEGVKALETRDPQQMKAAVWQMKSPMFWGSLGAFTAASSTVHAGLMMKAPGLAKGIAGETLPLAAGMAAIHLASGDFKWQNYLISTGTFAGLNLGMNAAMKPFENMLPGPKWGWQLGRLAATLYLAEKIESRIHKVLPGNHGQVVYPGHVRPETQTLLGARTILNDMNEESR